MVQSRYFAFINRITHERFGELTRNEELTYQTLFYQRLLWGSDFGTFCPPFPRHCWRPRWQRVPQQLCPETWQPVSLSRPIPARISAPLFLSILLFSPEKITKNFFLSTNMIFRRFFVDQHNFASSPKALKRPCFGQNFCTAGKILKKLKK